MAKKYITLTLSILLLLHSNAQENQYALSFDGINDYVNYSSQATVANLPITIQADVKLPANFQPGDQFFVYQSDDGTGAYSGFWMSVHYDFVEISFGDGSGDGSGSRQSKTCDHSFVFDQWVNLACVINGQNDMKIYQNGVELSGTYSGGGGNYLGDAPGNNSFSAHSVSSTAQVYSEGKLDNLAIWSTTLTQQQVLDYVTCPPTGNENDLVAFWSFEEGSGTTTADLTGNGHSGLLMNSPTWTTDTPYTNCGLSIEEFQTSERQLVKVVDELGREVEVQSNMVLFYIYSDGSVEKIFRVEP